MRYKFNNDVVAAIKRNLPEGEQIVPFLMNELFVGKESVYRRLRGDIAFTFDEIALLSAKLGFSVDNLIELKKPKQSYFEFNLFDTHDKEELYLQKMGLLIDLFAEVRAAKSVKSSFMFNEVPHEFTLYSALLSKFKYYKWMHQVQGIAADFRLSEMVVPERLKEIQRVWRGANRANVETTFVFDDYVFLRMANDIDYFYMRGLISDEELKELQKELLRIVNMIDDMSFFGAEGDHPELLIYLSSTTSGHYTGHFEYDGKTCCFTMGYGMNVLVSHNEAVCKNQKEWFNFHKRYATLVTNSGEMQRFEYLRQQEEYVMSIGKRNRRGGFFFFADKI